MRKRRLLIEKFVLITISMILLFVLLMAAALLDKPVFFTDSGLELVIRDKIDKPQEPIFRSDLLTITELDASGKSIKSLEGIEHLKQLVVLNLEDNIIKDVSPLADLNLLSELSLRNNEITDLEKINFDKITDLPLRKLSLRHNVFRPPDGEQVRLSEIELLQNFSQIEELELRDNHIEDILPLTGLRNLKVLDLRENFINDISPLQNLTALQELNLRENHLTCIDPLAELEQLEYLNIHSNQDVKSIEPLAGLLNLETLIMRNVPIDEEITALRHLTNLQRLNIRNCAISDTYVLAELMAAGALQDDPEEGIEAVLDIRENHPSLKGFDLYAPIRTKWDNITYRLPSELPSAVGTLEPPRFSHSGGFYEDGFLLKLATDDPDAKILYTIDGSKPCPEKTKGSVYYYKNQYPTKPLYPIGDLIARIYLTLQYSDPIDLSENIYDLKPISMINTTRARNAFIPPGKVFTGTVVRAATYKKGHLLSPIVTKSYFIGDDINERYKLPVISLVTCERNLFDYKSGIYVAGKKFDNWRETNPEELSHSFSPANYHQRGYEWEKEANIEFYSQDGTLLLDQLSGVRIHGGTTRANKCKSLRFYAREKYNEELFNIQLFQSKEKDKFKRFILRTSGNDFGVTLFRDALMQSLVEDLRIDQQAYQPAILFINGIYWGIHNIRDRFDKYYLHFRHGVEKDNLDILTHGVHFDDKGERTFIREIKEGDDVHYDTMISYLKAKNIKKPPVYEKIKTMMDVDNFADYCIAHIYFNNKDWPHNNMDYWRLKTDQYEKDAPHGHDGRWRWMLYDTDVGFGYWGGSDAYFHNTLEHATRDHWSTFLLRTLLQNEKFRNMFINRVADHLNTIFDKEPVLAQINGMQNNLAPFIQEHIDRWGQPKSFEVWEENVEMMKTFAQNRPLHLRKHFVEYFDLSGKSTVFLNTDFSKGKIVINSIDVSQSALKNSNKNSWKGIYFHDVPIHIEAIPKYGYTFKEWKGVDESDKALDVILKEDITLTAIFEKQESN